MNDISKEQDPFWDDPELKAFIEEHKHELREWFAEREENNDGKRVKAR